MEKSKLIVPKPYQERLKGLGMLLDGRRHTKHVGGALFNSRKRWEGGRERRERGREEKIDD